MSEALKLCQLRALVLICGTKIAENAQEILVEEKQPILYQLRGLGTASSETMDLLGLGSTAKAIFVSIMPRKLADKGLMRLGWELGLGTPGTGIAFTTAISGVNTLAMKVINEFVGKEYFETMDKDATQAVAKSDTSLVVAIVNQGYSEDVMEAARQFGAQGGTVLNARQVGSEALMNFLGIAVQEEKEMVLIITSSDKKKEIMQAIGEKCGMHSEAHGFVIATPIDAVVGFEKD